jgi:hypothetical protein
VAIQLTRGHWVDTVLSPTGVSAIKWWGKLLMITEAAGSLGIGGCK